jgi:hypothetical protein
MGAGSDGDAATATGSTVHAAFARSLEEARFVMWTSPVGTGPSSTARTAVRCPIGQVGRLVEHEFAGPPTHAVHHHLKDTRVAE